MISRPKKTTQQAMATGRWRGTPVVRVVTVGARQEAPADQRRHGDDQHLAQRGGPDQRGDRGE